MKKSEPIGIEPPAYINNVRIRLKCASHSEEEPGTVDVMLPVAEMKRDEIAMLAKLFPNTGEQAYRLLNVEALIASIVHE